MDNTYVKIIVGLYAIILGVMIMNVYIKVNTNTDILESVVETQNLQSMVTEKLTDYVIENQ